MSIRNGSTSVLRRTLRNTLTGSAKSGEGSDGFNEFDFRRAIARGLIFRATEKLVSSQPWYNGGYRANIVAYSLAVLSEITKRHQEEPRLPANLECAGHQQHLEQSFAIVAKAVNEDIVKPTQASPISLNGVRRMPAGPIQGEIGAIEAELPEEFWDELVSNEDTASDAKSAKKSQKIDNGIDAQRKVIGFRPVTGKSSKRF